MVLLRIFFKIGDIVALLMDGEGKELSTNPLCTQFSINYIQRRNQMSLQYSQACSDEVVCQFDNFVALLSHELINSTSIQKNPPLSKHQQIYTQLEARKTLLGLLEKGKVSGWRKNWKVDETNYLLFVIDKYCLLHRCKCEQLGMADWNCISSLIPNRDSSACQFRYLSLFPKPLSNVPWSSYERQLLHRIIQNQNQNSNSLNWKLISQRLYEQSTQKVFRTGKQCRQHYTCFLRPNLKKGPWTEKQDYMLINLFLKIGKKWSKMTKFIDGRNQNSIKNRFFLMFQNKKNMKLNNSDLVKMARRRKQKIQKKNAVLPSTILIQEQNAIITLNNSDSSNFEMPCQNEQIEQTPKTRSESSLIFNEVEKNNEPLIKIQNSDLFANEEFQRYISF